MLKHLLTFTGKSILALASIAVLSEASAQTVATGQAAGKGTSIELLPGTSQTIGIKFSPGAMQKRQVSTSSGTAYIISTDQGTPILKQGAPDLPKLTTSIIIPDHANTSVTIVSSTYADYSNIEIAPSKGNLKRTVDPSTVPYVKGDVYNVDAFFPSSLAGLGEPYILRDYRGQVVNVHPYQYNPVTKTLRVYSEIVIKVVVNDHNAPGFARVKPLTKVHGEFDRLYSRHFLNYSSSYRYTPVDEQGGMLIICATQYMAAMDPFVKWKTLKGIPVQLVDVATIGANETAIRSYVANYYNNNDLAYLLLVGDNVHIPAYNSSNGPSDNYYTYISGSDSYPELFAGRFSAESVAHVNTMVQRTITYEKYPSMTGTWYQNGIGIASDQGPGDDNEMDWEHERNIRTKLLNYTFNGNPTYTSVAELYDGSQGGADANGNPVASSVTSLVNAGCGLINYTGHGSVTDWVTTGFSNANITQLTNTSAWPLVISVGCVNGEFINGTCFAEAWTRATDSNGNPTGALATMMSTINQSWDPPMEGQDEMMDILVESYSNNIKRTFGGIAMNGCMKMNDTYGNAGDEMTDTWVLFGDPSVMVRTAPPGTMTVSHNSTTVLGTTSFQVNCNVNDAVVSLVQNGQVLGTGVVSGGLATINFSALSTTDTMFVTATAYNYAPYLGHVLVIPPSGPYVLHSAYAITDPTGNMDNTADFGEAINMDVTLNNIGVSTANSVTAVLSSADPNVTITDNTENYGSINAQSTATQAAAYAFTVANNVADQHSALFTLTITDTSGNTWTSQLSVVLNAPALGTAASLTISDPLPGGNNNGILDPGETATVIIPTNNTGNSNSPQATGVLTTSSSYITITTPSQNLGVINELGGSVNASFGITVSSSIPQATTVDLSYTVTAGSYSAQRNYNTLANVKMELFETNDFSMYPWTMSGDAPWVTTTENPYEGSYCSRSGVIANNDTSTMEITMYVTAADSIRFMRKVSSEEDWDFLSFYIDNVKVGAWSGLSGWERQAYPVGTGYRTFKWSYEKDVVVADNLDRVWVDAIQFPPGSLSVGVQSVSNASNDLSGYPNPFSDAATIVYSLKENADVRLSLFNAMGQEVQVLANGSQAAGTHAYTVNGNELAAGVYYCRLQAGNDVKMIRLMLAK